jgi:hypothetical protein
MDGDRHRAWLLSAIQRGHDGQVSVGSVSGNLDCELMPAGKAGRQRRRDRVIWTELANPRDGDNTLMWVASGLPTNRAARIIGRRPV